MSKAIWSDKEAPRKLATVVATISVVIPSMLLAYTALSLRDNPLSKQFDNGTILALVSSFCLFGTIASARSVDWLMDSITKAEWTAFSNGRGHHVLSKFDTWDQFIFRLQVFQGGYCFLAIIYAGLCVLFSNLIIISFLGTKILQDVFVLLPTMPIAATVFYQMMTDISRFAGTLFLVSGGCLIWGIIAIAT